MFMVAASIKIPGTTESVFERYLVRDKMSIIFRQMFSDINVFLIIICKHLNHNFS